MVWLNYKTVIDMGPWGKWPDGKGTPSKLFDEQGNGTFALSAKYRSVYVQMLGR